MKSPWRGGEQAGGQVSNTLLCALTQKGLLLENVLIDERKQRRPRSVVVVVVGDGRTFSFALQGVGGGGGRETSKTSKSCSGFPRLCCTPAARSCSLFQA